MTALFLNINTEKLKYKLVKRYCLHYCNDIVIDNQEKT